MKKITVYIAVSLLVAFSAGVIVVAGRETGYIKIDAPGFETDLSLRKIRTSLLGKKTISVQGSEPVEIPVGSYIPVNIVLRQTEDSRNWYSLISSGNALADLADIDIAKDQTTEIKLGPPLVIRTEVQQKQRTATISVSLIGRAGEKWNPQVLTPDGPRTAKLKIFDETEHILAEGRCQYG